MRKDVKENEWSNFKNFRKEEFKCKCTQKGLNYCNGYHIGIAYSLVELMQKVRDHYGKSITISSGLRCPKYNSSIGGDKNSNHQYGCACDFYFSGMNKNEVIKYLKTLPNYKYAYTNDTNMSNAVHITVYPTEEVDKPIVEIPKTNTNEPNSNENNKVVETSVNDEKSDCNDIKTQNNPLLHLIELLVKLFKLIFKGKDI